MKPLTDDNFVLAQIMQYLCERVENIVGKGENVTSILSFFPTMSSKGLFIVGVKTHKLSRLISCQDS